MADKVIKVVLIGVGNMGRNHFRVLAEDERFQLIAVVDPKAESLPFATLSKPPLYKSLTDLNCLDFDAAVVAAPTQTHHDIVSYLLQLGKDVLVEKPAASSHEQAVQLKKLAEEEALVLCVGNIERCNPAVDQLKKVVASGLIGSPIHINATRGGSFPKEVKEGNNVILDLAVHELDVIRMILGPLTILASVCHSTLLPGIHDTAEILVKSDHGVTASVHVNWLTPQKIRALRVTGSFGVCEIDYIQQSCRVHGNDLMSRIPVNMNNYELVKGPFCEELVFAIEKREPLKAQLDEFYKALGHKAHGLCYGEEMTQSVWLAEECVSRSEAGIVPAHVENRTLINHLLATPV